MSDSIPEPTPLDEAAFDRAMVAAAFRQAARLGWRNVRIAAAAREAGLSMARARQRFPSRAALLIRFGRLADAAALAEPGENEGVREKLFGMLMRRFDVLQTHRAGVLALLGSLPCRPRTALFLALLTQASMRWMLDAAGEATVGLAGRLRVQGLTAVWLLTLRAWQRDETADLAPTMAALDAALARAERAAGWLLSLPGAGPAASAASGTAEGPEASTPDGQSPAGEAPDGQPIAEAPFPPEEAPPEDKGED